MKTLKNPKDCYLGGGKFFANFRFLHEVLKINTLEKRQMSVFNMKFDIDFCSEIIFLF
jgi:hypothetical protein